MEPVFSQGDVVLFQGDSITDCDRSRSDSLSLGNGYAQMITGLFQAKYPELSVTFYNRAISGNRSIDLVERWDEDCIALKPDWISILIGINDTWRYFDRGEKTETWEFEENYRSILEDVRLNTKAGLILCEPFVLPCPDDRAAWRGDLDAKIHVVRSFAREYGAIYVPFDGIFAQAATRQLPDYWAADGVHPTAAGHALMAMNWLSAVNCTLG